MLHAFKLWVDLFIIIALGSTKSYNLINPFTLHRGVSAGTNLRFDPFHDMLTNRPLSALRTPHSELRTSQALQSALRTAALCISPVTSFPLNRSRLRLSSHPVGSRYEDLIPPSHPSPRFLSLPPGQFLIPTPPFG
jgi:hypothetical protein